MTTEQHDATAESVRAWKLQQGGASIRAIAAELGVSVGTAHARVRAAADAERVIGDPGDKSTARIREATALDSWQDAVEARLDDDPLSAVPVLLKVSAARRALLGLDAPQRVHVGDDRTAPEPDAELVAALAEARQTAVSDRRRAFGEGGGSER